MTRRSSLWLALATPIAAAAAHCGGAAFDAAALDGSVDDGGGGEGGGSSGGASSSGAASSSGGSTSSGGASSSGSASSSGAASGASTSSGGASSSSGSSSSGAASSSGSSGGSSSSGSSSGHSSSSGSSSSGASSSGGSSSGGGGACDGGCGYGRLCCSGACINPTNDPQHCGACDVRCGTGTYCNSGCKPIPCVDAGACGSGGSCCGTTCCSQGQLCCEAQGPVGLPYPSCFTPTASEPTCPVGCAPLCMSDRNLKRDIEPVDEQAVLESVAQVPVSSWSYKSDAPTVRHLGPMAQDFYAAFGLGDTDRAYNPIDAHGVELAAIKALYERSKEQDARIERLERENRELKAGGACR